VTFGLCNTDRQTTKSNVFKNNCFARKYIVSQPVVVGNPSTTIREVLQQIMFRRLQIQKTLDPLLFRNRDIICGQPYNKNLKDFVLISERGSSTRRFFPIIEHGSKQPQHVDLE
jgi:hypothetical protein